jgi:AbrB family looped-hinge helix DNA binding protein
MTTTVSSKGQIVLPVEIRQQDGVTAGQEFEIERIEEGEYVLRRRTPAPNKGLVKLLLACPVKDWFQPADRSETTDQVRAPKFV